MDRLGMYKIFTGVGRVAMAALLVASVGACGSKAKKPTTPDQVKAEPKDEKPITATIQPENNEAPPASEPIYFDYDKSDIRDVSKAVLSKVAEYLQKNPGASVTISGHTDERGTTEYNLMLGDQRAKAAHDYLVRLGIDPIRIKTISFGEERPAAPGSTEDAWQKNRRDEFNTATSK